MDKAEALAGLDARVLEGNTGREWVLVEWSPDEADELLPEALSEGALRLPSGWAEGCELVPVEEARRQRRTIAGHRVTDSSRFAAWTGSVRHPAVDGMVWVDPLPKQETGPVDSPG